MRVELRSCVLVVMLMIEVGLSAVITIGKHFTVFVGEFRKEI